MQTNASNIINRQEYQMYFLAVVCPQETDKIVLSYKHWMRDRFGCTAALKSPAHITLVAPFWLSETDEPQLLDALEKFNSRQQAFPVTLSNFSHFGNKVLFVHVEANEQLALLQGEVESYFRHQFPHAIKSDNRPFHPHVTIATRDMSPAAFRDAWLRFSRETYNSTFRVSSLTLLKLSPGKWNILAGKNISDVSTSIN